MTAYPFSAVVGQADVIEQLFAAIFTSGHCLLEGVPGLAKTKLVETMGRVLGLDNTEVRAKLSLGLRRRPAPRQEIAIGGVRVARRWCEADHLLFRREQRPDGRDRAEPLPERVAIGRLLARGGARAARGG